MRPCFFRTSRPSSTLLADGRAPSGRNGVARERFAEPDHGVVSSIASFHPHPRLCIVEEPPQLRQHVGRARRRSVQRVDPLQPLDHSACFVHGEEARGEPVPCLCRLCTYFVKMSGEGLVTISRMNRDVVLRWERPHTEPSS
jgi:hypothetical protein